jgi:hypothetical protein
MNTAADAAPHADSTPDGAETNTGATGGFDWDRLKAELEAEGGIRHKFLVAEMPRHPPIRLMTGVSESIEPFPIDWSHFRKNRQ